MRMYENEAGRMISK